MREVKKMKNEFFCRKIFPQKKKEKEENKKRGSNRIPDELLSTPCTCLLDAFLSCQKLTMKKNLIRLGSIF